MLVYQRVTISVTMIHHCVIMVDDLSTQRKCCSSSFQELHTCHNKSYFLVVPGCLRFGSEIEDFTNDAVVTECKSQAHRTGKGAS